MVELQSSVSTAFQTVYIIQAPLVLGASCEMCYMWLLMTLIALNNIFGWNVSIFRSLYSISITNSRILISSGSFSVFQFSEFRIRSRDYINYASNIAITAHVSHEWYSMKQLRFWKLLICMMVPCYMEHCSFPFRS